jgi:hypothetical protein
MQGFVPRQLTENLMGYVDMPRFDWMVTLEFKYYSREVSSDWAGIFEITPEPEATECCSAGNRNPSLFNFPGTIDRFHLQAPGPHQGNIDCHFTLNNPPPVGVSKKLEIALDLQQDNTVIKLVVIEDGVLNRECQMSALWAERPNWGEQLAAMTYPNSAVYASPTWTWLAPAPLEDLSYKIDLFRGQDNFWLNDF